MKKLLQRDVSQRITAKQALDHQWLSLFRYGAYNHYREEIQEKSKQQGMLGKVSSQLKNSYLARLDKKELEALINEFE